MKRRKLYFTVPSLTEAYKDNFPEVVQMATVSDTLEHFCHLLRVYIYQLAQSHKTALPKDKSIASLPLHSAARRIHQMLSHEGKIIQDYVSKQEIKCSAIESLWKALRYEKVEIESDFLLDWYHLLEQLQSKTLVKPSIEQIENDRNRWPSGLINDVFYERRGNRTLIQQILIEKIDNRKKNNSRYHFIEGMNFAEKQEQVRNWWFDYQFQLAMAIRSANELNYFMGTTLSHRTMDMLYAAERKGHSFFITPYYLSLLSVKAFGYDDAVIRNHVLSYIEPTKEKYQMQIIERKKHISLPEPDAAGWSLPFGNVYTPNPETIVLFPTSTKGICNRLCTTSWQTCSIPEEVSSPRQDTSVSDKGKYYQKKLIEHLQHNKQLKDILITGGNILMDSNSSLKKLLETILQIARKRKEANEIQSETGKYTDIERIRISSRTLACLPYRINNKLIAILRNFRDQAQQIGMNQFFIQTYFESPLEITTEVMEIIRKIQECGWIVTNQQLFTVASSRRGHSAAMRQTLNRAGVLPYYTFATKGFVKNQTQDVPMCRLIQEMKEEKTYGELTPKMKELLQKTMLLPQRMLYDLNRLLNSYQRPFLATDENMATLPGIGKSTTFTTVGLTCDGRRILRFMFDTNRNQNPTIQESQEVYMIENKSIAFYLRQLEHMGEREKDYDSIWYYNEGKEEATENIFHVYVQNTRSDAIN